MAMILDTADRIGRYAGLHPAFPRAFSMIADGRLAELSPGRHDVDGENFYVSLGVERKRPRERSPLEAHRKYIDIHVPLKGADHIGWKPLADCVHLRQLYDAGKDVAFFSDDPDLWFPVAPGCFAIFFPDDAHAPLTGEGTILKAVFKIRMEQ